MAPNDDVQLPDRPTCVIADDHAIVRAGIRSLIEQPGQIVPTGIGVVAEADEGLGALLAVKKQQPTLLILDLQMPGTGGAEIIADVRRWSPDTRVIILTGVTNATSLAQIVDMGVDGLVPKGGNLDALYEAIPIVLAGGRYIDEDLVESFSIIERPPLTPREHECLLYTTQGLSVKELADRLSISPRTAEKHRASLMKKLGARTAMELVAIAVRDGFIDASR